MKNKAFVALAFLGIVPLLVLGIVTNLVATSTLEKKLNSMANQTIDKLSISISRDLQGFVDMAFYHSRNYRVIEALRKVNDSEGQNQTTFYDIRSEILQNQVVRRVNYPFHYIVISREGTIFTNFSYSLGNNYDGVLPAIEGEKWYNALKESYSQQIWLFTNSHYLSPRKERQIYIASNIRENIENVGIMVLGIDEYYVSRLLKNVRISDRSSLYIIDRDGKCLVEGETNFYSFQSLPESLVSAMKSGGSVPVAAKIHGQQQMVISNELYLRDVEGSWRILMVTPLSDIHKDINNINYVTVLMILISLAVIIFLIVLINREIINPIIKLNGFTKEVQMGNLDVRAVETRKDEIGQLGHGFNKMAVNLKGYIGSIQEEEKAKRELEISVLQSQINPHFVRNTLNVIRWMAEMLKVPGISQAISAFIKLLDYNFEKFDAMVTVREEISYLEEYIYLQKLRYQNKFCSIFDIESSILDYKVLKLTFQPLVENSILHGLERKKGLGTIFIKVYREENDLCIIIKDDGVGMDENQLEGLFRENRSEKKHRRGLGGIGLANVQKRIKLNFGEKYGMTVKSAPGEGTEIRILFPAIDKIDREGDGSEDIDCG